MLFIILNIILIINVLNFIIYLKELYNRIINKYKEQTCSFYRNLNIKIIVINEYEIKMLFNSDFINELNT